MRKITKVQPKATKPLRRKRVSAYARVSSGKEAMLHSLSAQISYYNSYIGKRGDWEFAGVYADEALTGTKAARPAFQKLLEDCRAGKIDMIITKSITRFARNTVTLLEAARELKLLGIDIFFERENIHTLSADGEFMLTLLASFAQEESRSASENQKWRIRKMFEQGRPNTGKMLGYRLVDGVLYVVTEEAEIVKKIFAGYLSGLGVVAITKRLNDAKIPAKCGSQWYTSAVHGILRNEKYTGDMLLQKTFVSDHIGKKIMKNRGELPMYFVQNSHEAIIAKEDFAAVQREIVRRAEKYRPKTRAQKTYPFTGLLRCDQCGGNYHRKITGVGGPYAKPVWICDTFNTVGKSVCPSQQIPEDILVAKTRETLGLSAELSAKALRNQLSAIRVPARHQLIYVFLDGHTKEVSWQNPSRRTSWTPEKREAARQQKLAFYERKREESREAERRREE